jgi:hypothetical protein
MWQSDAEQCVPDETDRRFSRSGHDGGVAKADGQQRRELATLVGSNVE